MQSQLNTDRHISADDKLASQIETALEGALHRFSDQVTRVEVHLSDVNSDKGGDDDKRCVLEARLAGLRPVAVSHQAASIQQAIDGAAQKLERSLDSTLGKLEEKKGRSSYGGDGIL